MGPIEMLNTFWLLLIVALLAPEAAAAAEQVAENPFWLWTFLGRLHPLIVHFPIALLICAAAGEFAVRWAPGRRVIAALIRDTRVGENARGLPGDVVVFCVLLGSASALVATGLGWLHAESQDYSGNSLDIFLWHRRAGVFTAAASMATAILIVAIRRGGPTKLGSWYRVGLVASALGAAVSGHFGGSLVFGDDYLVSALPGGREPAIELADLPTTDRRIDFVRDIQPIFEQACLECHGEKKQKGMLRLDAQHLAIHGGKSGKAIVPGDSTLSMLVTRVLGQGVERRMPLENDALSHEQIASLMAWIEQGANWPLSASNEDAIIEEHWAYTSPSRPDPPKVANERWVRNPIDRFVLARMEKEGFEPSPEADREALIRRLSFDLIGLPPTVDEVDAYVADTRPDAYERVVDRLLASAHYGEKWARHWLDLARYADSDGYDQDGIRTAWTYRDWVIDAFNRDIPFDEFTRLQIAGDMLPKPTLSNRIATGFHRNSMINREAGVDLREAHWESLVDRVNTVGSVWLGSTIECAQCHDHKFDPFTQRDYYAFLAFFNNANLTPEIRKLEGVAAVEYLEETTLIMPDSAQVAKRAMLKALVKKLEGRLSKRAALDPGRPQWELDTLAAVRNWRILELDQRISTSGAELETSSDRSVLVGGVNPNSDRYRVSGISELDVITGVRLEVLTDATLPANGPGRFHDGGFVLTGFEAVDGTAADGTDRAIGFSEVRADNSDYYFRVESLIAKPGVEASQRALGEQDGWASAPGEDHQAVFKLAQPIESARGHRLVFELDHGSDVVGHLGLGRFRISVTSSSDPFATVDLPEEVGKSLAIPEPDRTSEQRAALIAHYRNVAPGLAPLREEISEVRKISRKFNSELRSALVLEDAEHSGPLTAALREGGAFTSPGEPVEAGFPEFLNPYEADRHLDRTDLAKWLVDEANPLVARVAVNRYWQQIFGRGLVDTVDDFGTQGADPTHPDLQDWLAVEFVDQGWRAKAMHRLIVTSATYRQSSKVTPELLAADPGNSWLARAGRIRLPVEHIRDAALASSGLLSRKIGGPSVFPYQPPDVWRFSLDPTPWKISEGQDRHRRSVYTFWRRSTPYPMFTLFDAPSRERTAARRIQTNTPLQSLVLLNDYDHFEAARALARRISRRNAPSVRDGARYGFRAVLTRTPQPDELDSLVGYFDSEREHFENDKGAAEKLLGWNLPGDEVPAGILSAKVDTPSLAAWTMLASVLLNLDEAITKQ